MITRTMCDGSYECSDIINGVRVWRRYNGYTKREAERLFRAYCDNYPEGWYTAHKVNA